VAGRSRGNAANGEELCRRPPFGDQWNKGFVHPVQRPHLGLLNAKFEECFKRNHLKMFVELACLSCGTCDSPSAPRMRLRLQMWFATGRSAGMLHLNGFDSR
jgi:hypothetical protein